MVMRKQATVTEIKDYYDNEEELFDYANIDNFYSKDDDFGLGI